MSQSLSLLKIGSTVQVDLDLVQDRFPEDLVNRLKDNPTGKILDYKMTDGNSIGIVVELSDKSKIWLFDTEVSCLESSKLGKDDFVKKPKSVSGRSILTSFNKEQAIKTNRSAMELINPIYLFQWLRYSFKDVL